MLFLLAALTVWSYAALVDVRQRRVPNSLLGLLVSLGVLRALTTDLSLLALALSVGVLCPLAVVLWTRYDFGGADAKALMVGSLVYPDAIGVFLVGTGLGFVACKQVWSDDVPAIVAVAGGATVATGVMIL